MPKYIMLAVAIAATLVVPGLGIAQSSSENRIAPGEPPVIIAHRAVGGGSPENSLAGLQYAIDHDIDMVEIDVQMTREGQYIVMHDPNLIRTTNVHEVFPDGAPSREPGDRNARRHFVRDYALEEIAKLRLRDPLGGDHPVPSLDAALELAEGRLLVMLDLKSWDNATLVPLLNRYDTGNLLLFTSFGDPKKLNDTAEATGIGVFATLTQLSDVDRALDRAVEDFSSQLMMVDAISKRLTPELLMEPDNLGVMVAIAGEVHEDFELMRGNPDPWKAALDSGAGAFWTKQPDALLELLER